MDRSPQFVLYINCNGGSFTPLLSYIGDVSTAEEEVYVEEPAHDDQKQNITSLEDDIIPEPFDIEEHLSIVKENRLKRSTGNQERFVLFVIDTSGSIGST